MWSSLTELRDDSPAQGGVRLKGGSFLERVLNVRQAQFSTAQELLA